VGNPFRAFESYNLKRSFRCRPAAGAVEASPTGQLNVVGHHQSHVNSIDRRAQTGREPGSPDVDLKKQVEQASRVIERFLLRGAGGRDGRLLACLAPLLEALQQRKEGGDEQHRETGRCDDAAEDAEAQGDEALGSGSSATSTVTPACIAAEPNRPTKGASPASCGPRCRKSHGVS